MLERHDHRRERQRANSRAYRKRRKAGLFAPRLPPIPEGEVITMLIKTGDLDETDEYGRLIEHERTAVVEALAAFIKRQAR